ncbi:hypothetical protein LC55x_3070 [Lysobacter capsici]|uniref:Uncharacterized protein n=1 Tax=Lysobacter capsici AZ78 TaxID=1444315 RepID=A0A108U4S7_9GAMM|nr:hypothetical protein LC55x_3070 [Lysobacter capsici]KWS02550.1 hypothetical protein AZ78_0094 [Lysobacter capsici AZ78]
MRLPVGGSHRVCIPGQTVKASLSAIAAADARGPPCVQAA